MIKSGVHLRTVRNWIQDNAINGDTVTWNSDDVLRMKPVITPKLLEELAQKICDDVMKDVIKKIQRNLNIKHRAVCTKFIPKSRDIRSCQICGHTKEMHDIIDGKTW